MAARGKSSGVSFPGASAAYYDCVLITANRVTFLEASIRQLKANLSAYIKRVAAGEAVTVSVRNRPVARIVPFTLGAVRSELKDLPGVQWNGGKPAGLPKGETMRKGVSLSAWSNADRR